MSTIDTKLYDSLENNISIDNSFGEDAADIRISLADNFKAAKIVLNVCSSEFEFSDDVYQIIRTIKVVKSDDKPAKYDRGQNVLSYGNFQENKEYYRLASMMDIVTQRYNENRRCSGLIDTDINGKEKNVEINEMLRDRIILVTTGLSNEKEYDFPSDKSEYSSTQVELLEALSAKEERFNEVVKKVGIDKMIEAYAHAKGDIFDIQEEKTNAVK